jgi:hypothetical protein
VNDDEFEQWQEQRNAAMFAALMELLRGIEQNTRHGDLARDCMELLKEFDV